MTFLDFENSVRALSDEQHYAEYRHVLPAINTIFRDRFIATLQAGFNIHQSFDHVSNACRLPESNYMRYLNYLTRPPVVAAAESFTLGIPALI